MAIKVASEGYDGTSTGYGGVMLINGTLHECIRPVSSSEALWVPVRSYDGPVEHVDTRGRPIAESRRQAGAPAGGE